ncbi:hypothetical protein QN277_005564 [Acacia crassicarpa]|uniref:Uncharacterized protein n=1 Tax=Acacia crassicarpa TaxID=499986 RepID=A0AAE1MBQ2_9FABA|nr:hypothetical protein QN277_005564 [Acacia crassicarpa]
MLNACEDSLYGEMAKFGAYLKSEYGISPSTAISLILGCVCLFMFVKRRWGKKQEKPKQKLKLLQRSKSVARMHGGDLALRRLYEYQVAEAVPHALEGSDLVLKGLLQEEHLDLKKLQIVTARLEMAGQEEKGVTILEDAKRKNVNLNKSHHVYEIDMLLAELLIYNGQHNEALKCECLNDQNVIEHDARRPLFQAIIYGMQQNWGKAEHFWNEFKYLRQEILSGVGQGEPEPDVADFTAFKRVVKRVQNEIEEKKKRNPNY